MGSTIMIFDQARKYENDGLFKEAKVGYASALIDLSHKKLQSKSLKDSIINKLKILNTVVEYDDRTSQHKIGQGNQI